MLILGLETSCDETAAAIVEDGVKIISNVVASSAEMHAKTGGVIPEEAARQQVKSMIPVLKEALGNYSPKDIDAIAVTVGPGLIGSLLVGVEAAKTLSYLWKKPIIPINHLVGHIYANWLDSPNLPQFPALALVVSGGHTDLVLIKDHGKLEWIGGTRDDAAGEAFDKTARILGLPYPGGPTISKFAESFRSKNPGTKLNLFPRPMINEDNFDLSFSGLKTAVINETKNKELTENYKEKIAAEVEEAIVEVLVAKSLKAIEKYHPKSFLLAGGVSANKALRETFEEKILSPKKYLKIQKKSGKNLNFSGGFLRSSFHVPKVNLCTDNAAYIASCGFFNYKPVDWKGIDAQPQLTITSKVEV